MEYIFCRLVEGLFSELVGDKIGLLCFLFMRGDIRLVVIIYERFFLKKEKLSYL